jgi:hypothetical protein
VRESVHRPKPRSSDAIIISKSVLVLLLINGCKTSESSNLEDESPGAGKTAETSTPIGHESIEFADKLSIEYVLNSAKAIDLTFKVGTDIRNESNQLARMSVPGPGFTCILEYLTDKSIPQISATKLRR